jgi:hypothetical protein
VRSKSLILCCVALLSLLALLAACGPKKESGEEATAPAGTDAGGAPAAVPGGTAATTEYGVPGTAAPAPGAAAPAPGAAAPAAPGVVLASQETNWPGIVVEVTQFQRKGNTLTAKFRVSNRGGAKQEPAFQYDEVYIMDAAAGKKYEALKDEGGSYIAALRAGWKDRWYGTLEPGESAVLWVKFPAPPAEVTAVTFQLPNTPPFDDLAIQG